MWSEMAGSPKALAIIALGTCSLGEGALRRWQVKNILHEARDAVQAINGRRPDTRKENVTGTNIRMKSVGNE